MGAVLTTKRRQFRHQKLLAARDLAGLRNADIAASTGLSESVISRTLRGLSQNGPTVAAIAEFLSVPMGEIVPASDAEAVA